MKFLLSLIRADLLARGDRIDDAESSILNTAVLERDYAGDTLISRAVRGDIRARLGDAAAGEGDLARVALALEGWQLPTEFDEMPDMIEIVINTEAKFRAALGLASGGLARRAVFRRRRHGTGGTRLAPGPGRGDVGQRRAVKRSVKTAVWFR